MKPFTKPIFYGNASKYDDICGEYERLSPTAKDIQDLKSQVEELMSINSGRQQPCRCGKCKDHWEEDEKRKKELIESIKIALEMLI